MKKIYLLMVFMVLLSSIFPNMILKTYGIDRKFKVTVSVQSLGGIIYDAYGDIVDIRCVLPEGAEPHSFQVSPDIIASLSDTDIFVFTGHFSFEYSILDSYKDKPALYLDVQTGYYGKYKLKLLDFPGNESRGYNPHGYWLLPVNALRIAAAFKDLLISIDPGKAEIYNNYYERFEYEVEDIMKLYDNVSIKYGLRDSYVLLGFPAEEYIVYPLNVNIVGVIVRGPGQVITPNELSKVMDILSNKPNKYVIASDIAMNMAVGSVLNDVKNLAGSKIIYVDVVSSFKSYKALIYYNLGRLTGGLLSESPSRGSNREELNSILLLFNFLLIVVVIVEGIYIYVISKVY